MIKISNLSKHYGNQKVLNDINLSLPDKGLIAFLGPSGCGKTTLLSCISGLINFEGEVIVNNTNLKTHNEYKLSKFRLENIGFVFQDYKLFESQDIYSNIIFPYESIYIDTHKNKKNKVIDLLKIVKLKKTLKTKVNKLSGGEKQRVAIARSLINNPSLVICDEPTGNLDESNSIEIMELLKSISKKALVILVSHNHELTHKYADVIYTLEDGVIVDKEIIKNRQNTKGILLKKNKGRIKKPNLNYLFILRHVINKIKQKKYRSLVSTSMMGLGLMSFGLSISLSNLIGDNIKTAYSSVIQEDRIIVSKKDFENKSDSLFACEKDEVEELFKQYQGQVYDYGYYYLFPFEDAFKDTNEFVMHKSFEKTVIEGLSVRNVNEFKWLDFNDEVIYPHKKENLNNGEVILGLTIDSIMEICYQLRIKRTVESLSTYLASDVIPISLYTENLNWGYQDYQIFDVVGFVLENKNCIYHSNHRWNEYVFENAMRFPISENIYGVLDKPWILRKIPYFHIESGLDRFLELSLKEMLLQKFIFEVAGENFYPILSLDNKQKTNQKLLIFVNNLSGILPIYSDYFMKANNNLSKPIFGSSAGYLIYPTLMIMGFAQQTYFSSSIDGLEKVVDMVSNYNLSENENYEFPDDVLLGHYANTQQNNVVFDVFNENVISGRYPNNYDEIMISSQLADSIFKGQDIIDKEIFLAHIVKENQLSNGNISRTFKYVHLNICGVIKDYRNAIFHNSYWPIVYYQKNLNYSRIALDCNYLSFEVKNKSHIPKIVDDLNNKFDSFSFYNPSEEINSGIDEVCGYMQIILSVFSLLTVTISILLLSVSNYLFISENKKEMSLLKFVGLSKKESSKFLYAYSFIMSLFSFVLGTSYLCVTNFLLNSQVARLLNSQLNFKFDILSTLLMLLLSIVVSFMCSLFFQVRSNKKSKLFTFET